MEANPDGGTKPLLSVVARQVSQLLDLYLVRLQKEANREFFLHHLLMSITCPWLM